MDFKEQPDEWKEDVCLKMIREFRKRPILWNPNHIYYYKKAMKPAAWQEVAENTGMPAKACKYKMNILMSSLRREKSKIKKWKSKTLLEPTGKTQPYESRWFAYKAMSFLINKKADSKIDFTVVDDSTDIDVGGPCVNSDLNKRKISNESSTKELDDCTMKQEIEELEEEEFENQHNHSNEITNYSVTTNTADDDEIKSFANFIAAKMKKYDAVTKNIVQKEICDIIFKADQK